MVAAAGCLADPGLEPGGAGLVDATEDQDHPAVGVVAIGIGECTGTLVAPRVVVTAKHCLPAGATPRISFRTGPRGETEVGTGVAVFTRTPPQGYVRQSDDIVAILLDRDVAVAPIPIRRAPMDGRLEERTVTLVGYGTTGASASDFGTRRSGLATIDSVSRRDFETRRDDGQVTSCNGDSGGAVILDGELAGVIIGSVWGNCRKIAIHTRVDQYGDVVDQALSAAATLPLATPPAPEDPPAADPPPDDAPPADEDVQPNVLLCDPGYCVPDDGLCDEDLACCSTDPDCVAPEPAPCDCDVTWGCDDCWCEPAEECAA